MTTKQPTQSAKRGFTLVELVITIALFAIIAVVGGVSLFGTQRKSTLTGTVQQIAALLREAQSDAMAGEQGTAWGVHFENATATAPFYSLFASSTYSPQAIVGGYYRLPASVGYATSSLPAGAAVNITFSPITGTASASTSITLYSLGSAAFSSTISIASSGAVSD